jgi:hypothetical protein
MKSLPLSVVILLAGVLVAVAPASNTLSTWSAYVDSWATYVPNANDPAANEVAAFTPECAVLVTRVEIDAHIGPYAIGTPAAQCIQNQSLTLTDGKTPYTLILNTPPNVLNGGLHSYTDSGAIKLKFPEQTKLTLLANQGDPAWGNEVNVVVHYALLPYKN